MNHEKFSNEPNFKNPQINVTNVPRKDYMKIDAFSPRKNEPNPANPARPEQSRRERGEAESKDCVEAQAKTDLLGLYGHPFLLDYSQPRI